MVLHAPLDTENLDNLRRCLASEAVTDKLTSAQKEIVEGIRGAFGSASSKHPSIIAQMPLPRRAGSTLLISRLVAAISAAIPGFRIGIVIPRWGPPLAQHSYSVSAELGKVGKTASSGYSSKTGDYVYAVDNKSQISFTNNWNDLPNRFDAIFVEHPYVNKPPPSVPEQDTFYPAMTFKIGVLPTSSTFVDFGQDHDVALTPKL